MPQMGLELPGSSLTTEVRFQDESAVACACCMGLACVIFAAVCAHEAGELRSRTFRS